MPAGTILSRVQLVLIQESVRSTPGTDNGKSATLQLHRVTSNWTEGAGGEGTATPCAGGETVSGIDWAGAPDNEPSPSSTETLPATINSEPPPPPIFVTIDTDSGTDDDQLINDILAWYASPGNNRGWKLSVNEDTDNARVLNPFRLTLTWADPSTQYSIGGSVSGLSGTGLVLQNNAGDDLSIAANGSFTFDTALDGGSAYSVTVLTQPGGPDQTCSVTNGSGTLAGANITDVSVSCTTDTYTIGGNVSGLSGTGLVLQNNAGDDLPIAADGNFTFATALDDGSAYSVTVLTQPSDPEQTCSVSSGSGTLAGTNVTTVAVNCTTDTFTIGGNVSGLTGSGLVLQNNAGDNLPIAADGSFTFVTALDDGSDYSVTVLTQPSDPNQTCYVSSGSGTLAGTNVTTVAVNCTTDTFTIGGNVSGLTGTGLVLQNNAGDDLPIAANGSFTFDTALDDGSAYSVTVLTQPNGPNQTCSVSNGGGTLAGADIVDVNVTCITKPENIFADSFEE